MFISKFFDILNFTKGDMFWPWRKHPYFLDKEIKCQIIDIQYEFPKLRGKKVMNELRDYLTIIMKIKLRIFAGVFLYREPTKEETQIKCGKLVEGKVCFGELIETGLPTKEECNLSGKEVKITLDGKEYSAIIK